jgi:hypothetical protein
MYKKYKNSNNVINDTAIIRTIDNVCIPFDPANTDYQEYLAWIDEGNEPLSADDPNTIL